MHEFEYTFLYPIRLINACIYTIIELIKASKVNKRIISLKELDEIKRGN